MKTIYILLFCSILITAHAAKVREICPEAKVGTSYHRLDLQQAGLEFNLGYNNTNQCFGASGDSHNIYVLNKAGITRSENYSY